MKKTAFFLTLILGIYLFLSPHLQVTNATEVPKKAINIILDHSNPALPTVISVSIVDTNPEYYQLSQRDHFFIVREVDENGSVLFQGEVKRYKLAAPAVEGDQYTEIPDNPVLMNIPYHMEARKVRILDETGNQLLEIDLGLYSVGPTPTAEPRYADCNKCGYCKRNTKQPGDLQKCMTCLYPDFVSNPDGTLIVDPKKNQPVQPRSGAYYTQLGCIDVGAEGFRNPAAAGGVVQVILARLIFPVTGVLSLLALIYGAFLVMTSQNDPQKLIVGKKWIMGAAIGTVFTFMVVLLIRIIGGDILKIPGLDI